MRIELVAIVAALGISVSACASAPNHDYAVEVPQAPMYTNAEWAEMNSACSVPEIATGVASNTGAAGSYAGYSRASDDYGSSGFRDLGGGSASTFVPTLGRASIFPRRSLADGFSFGFSGRSAFGHIHGHLGGGGVHVHGHH